MLDSISNTNISDFLKLATVTGKSGKIGLPVSSGSFVSLKNVYGYGANGDQRGYTISKLKVLDSLVESLRLNRKRGMEFENGNDLAGSQDVEKAIGELLVKLEEVLGSSNNPYGQFYAPPGGQVVDLFA